MCYPEWIFFTSLSERAFRTELISLDVSWALCEEIHWARGVTSRVLGPPLEEGDRTIPYSTVIYHTIPYSTVQYRTVPYITIPYSAIPHLQSFTAA